jgi:hypothetical protein
MRSWRQRRIARLSPEQEAVEDDSSKFDWSSDDEHVLEEKAAESRALVESFETLKKTEDAIRERGRPPSFSGRTANEATGGGEAEEGGRQRRGRAIRL